MKETQRKLLPSKPVVSITSFREEILVLLNSYHIGPFSPFKFHFSPFKFLSHRSKLPSSLGLIETYSKGKGEM